MFLKTSIGSLPTEDQDLCTDLKVEKQVQQAIALYWLPSAANDHVPAQQYEDHMIDTHTSPPKTPR